MSLLEFFLAAEAWAAGGGEHHDADISGIIFPFLNFLIYAGIIYYFGFPLLRSFLKSRREQVVAILNEATARRQRAEALLQDYKQRLANLDQETKSIQELLKSEGEREKTRLISEAEMIAAKIKSDAQFLAEQEVKAAKQQVLEDVAERAKALATELVRRHISPADQSRLVEEFISHIGEAR